MQNQLKQVKVKLRKLFLSTARANISFKCVLWLSYTVVTSSVLYEIYYFPCYSLSILSGVCQFFTIDWSNNNLSCYTNTFGELKTFPPVWGELFKLLGWADQMFDISALNVLNQQSDLFILSFLTGRLIISALPLSLLKAICINLYLLHISTCTSLLTPTADLRRIEIKTRLYTWSHTTHLQVQSVTWTPIPLHTAQ